jgi:ParB-like chromosome segregation protein Spo0J
MLLSEHRWRAARLAGMATITPVLHEGPTGPAELPAVRLIDNALREHPGSIEQAGAFKRIMDRHGLSTRRVAEELSVAQSSASRTSRPAVDSGCGVPEN